MSRIAVPLRRVFLACLSFSFFVSPAAFAEESNPARTRPATQQQPTAQRIIIKFRQGVLSTQAANNGEAVTAAAVAAANSRMKALASRARINLHGSRAIGTNMHVMEVSPLTNNETEAETLAHLRADSEVEFAELDRRVYPHAVSNDPLAPGQWYLQNVQPSSVDAQGAWDVTTGSNGVVVAVVDTGVIFDHPDLRRASSNGKFLPGYDFVSPDPPNNTFNTANDGDGRDPDASDPGDWVTTADNCGPPSNSSWHGTRVSGMIAALTNNSTGVAGVMWDGYIVPVRVIGKCGGYNSDVLAGVRWAAGLNVPGVPANRYPAQIINISLGGLGSCDAASQAVISEVAAAGVLVVVSAGNEGGPVDSPANCNGAMGILGLRAAGTKVGFSSLGPQIALGAPGGNCINVDGGPCIFSLDTTSNSGTTSPATNTYTNQINANVGTSFASPIVSGIAGLMLSVNGNLKGPQLIKRMQDGSKKPFPTTSDTGTPPVCRVPTGPGDIQGLECSCTTQTCGAGMANAKGAVEQALRPIAAISAPTSVSPGGNVTLNGGGSAAACNRTVTSHAWTVVSGTVTLTNANTPSAGLQAPTSGTAVVRLTVTDDAGRTDSADISISPSTTSTTAPANAGSKACLTAVTLLPAVTVTATDANAAEAGPDTGTFTLTRTGDMAAALAVTFSIGGTATNGTDYVAIPTSVTIPAGQASATITVTPIDDSAVEGSETVVLAVQGTNNYDPGTPASATVTIADDDTASAPPPSIGNPNNGGGGGGRLDLLTLLAMMAFAARAVSGRRATRAQFR